MDYRDVYVRVAALHVRAGFHPAVPPGPAPLARILLGARATTLILASSPRVDRCLAVATALARWELALRPCAIGERDLAVGIALPLPALAICSTILSYSVEEIGRIFDVPPRLVWDVLRGVAVPPCRSGEYAMPGLARSIC